MADLIDENVGSIVPAQVIGGVLTSQAVGSWTIAHAEQIELDLKAMQTPTAKKVSISLKEVKALDTSGAWLLLGLRDKWAVSYTHLTLPTKA